MGIRLRVMTSVLNMSMMARELGQENAELNHSSATILLPPFSCHIPNS
ncbi:MAG: hypothetical protein JNL58_05570 [Planctomyces sp.]|nr:hypothetical protein [Planctomyces sp.]